MSLPLDGDGFLRRQCPTCERDFKWLPSPEGTGESAADAGYFCPYCSIQAPTNAWYTEDQLAYARAIVSREVVEPEIEKLKRSLADISRSSGGLISMSLRSESRSAPRPLELSENSDMRRVD